jgi:hypothetical protein
MRGGLLFNLLAIAWVLAIVPLVSAASSRLLKGTWRPHRSGTGLVWFDSDLGRFAFDHSGHLRAQAWHEPERVIPLAEVRGIRFAYARQTMVDQLAEFDLEMKARSGLADELDRYDVVLVTTSGDVPVFVAGQLFRRVIGAAWLTDRATDLVARLGLIPAVEAHDRTVVDDLQRELAARGHPARLV